MGLNLWQRVAPVRLASVLVAVAFLVVFASSCGDQGPTADSRQVQRAMAEYKSYLEENSDKLTHWAETIVAKAKEGTLQKAASRYAAARVPYGHIGPAAELHADLNARIDSTE